MCFNKKIQGSAYTFEDSEFDRDDINYLKLYRDALAINFTKSFGFYDSSLAHKAIHKIFTVGSVLTQSTGIKDMIKRSQEALNNIFNSHQSKIAMVHNKKFTFLDHQTSKYLKKYDITRGGIMYEVYKTGKYRFSECTSNDPFFNRLCDLDSQLPSITYPIHDPSSLEIIGVF